MRERKGLCCPAPSIAAGSSVLRRLEFDQPSRLIPHTERADSFVHQGFVRCKAPPIAPIRNPLFRNPHMPRPGSGSTSFCSWCESEKEIVGREQFMVQVDPKALISMHFAS